VPVSHKQDIAEAWMGRVLRTTPPESAAFRAKECDPFRNPAGSIIRGALEILLDELLAGMDRSRVTPALDSIMQIRAVEDLAPSHALEFLFQLKDILRLECDREERELLNGRIDEMALLAFDLYMKYRERTYQARQNEARRRLFVLERRMRIEEAPAQAASLPHKIPEERGGI